VFGWEVEEGEQVSSSSVTLAVALGHSAKAVANEPTASSPAARVGAVWIAARAALASSCLRLGESVEDVSAPLDPAALLAGLGEDVAQGRPEAQWTIAGREDGSLEAPVAQAPQEIRPAVGRLAVAGFDRDELLRPIGPRPTITELGNTAGLPRGGSGSGSRRPTSTPSHGTRGHAGCSADARPARPREPRNGGR
jgi:hypothetical protein